MKVRKENGMESRDNEERKGKRWSKKENDMRKESQKTTARDGQEKMRKDKEKWESTVEKWEIWAVLCKCHASPRNRPRPIYVFAPLFSDDWYLLLIHHVCSIIGHANSRMKLKGKRQEKDHRWRTVSARVKNETQNPKHTDDFKASEDR